MDLHLDLPFHQAVHLRCAYLILKVNLSNMFIYRKCTSEKDLVQYSVT